MIRLEDVSFRYPKARQNALEHFSLSIPRGSFFALLGPNGAGKTTLMRLLCGRLGAYEGFLAIAEDFRGNDGFLDPSKLGVLLENPGIYPKLSIAEYVAYFAGFYGLAGEPLDVRMQKIAGALELPALDTKLSALSLGNRQKVQILRAMVPNPKLLILDEPVANLDPKSREAVWNLIADWRRNEGGTAIVCSHILAEMEQEATDFAIIDRGTVLKQGHVADLYEQGSIQMDLPRGISVEQVSLALNAAGLGEIKVRQSRSTLSDLYRKTVQ